MRIRVGLTAALVVPAVLLIAGSASAALSTSRVGDTLVVASTIGNEPNGATMQFNDENELVFKDSVQPPVAGYCPVIDGEINCGLALLGVERFRFELSGGDDTFAIFEPNLIGLPKVRISMGSGDDQVFSLASSDVALGPGNDTARLGFLGDEADGGAGNDRIFGAGGDDRLEGGPGNDKLIGPGLEEVDTGQSDGRDVFNGGPGKDKVKAKDFTKDRKIDCGPGRDKLRRDSFDPKPKSC